MKLTFVLWFYVALFCAILSPHLIAIETAADGQTPLEGGDVELRAKAEKGDAEAQFYIGANYIDGIGVAKNIKEALVWYRKSANQGYAEAQFNLGIVYENGLGVEKDDTEAFNWYKKAAEHGHDAAMLNLAQMYQEGRGVSKDEDKAKAWFEKVRQQEKSEGSTMDDIKNMPSLRPPSPQPDQSEAEAQYRLGMKYLYGFGPEISKDEAEALKLILQAANQGLMEAQAQLGLMYIVGRGVLKDEKEAVKWYRMAAEQENTEAQMTVASMYYTGDGVLKDPEEAAKWYRMAAEQGNTEAQMTLASMYYNGGGMPKDPKEVIKWLRMAADQGLDMAQFNLGVIYAEGEGVPKDPKEAVKWYRMAAEQGLDSAQFNLGNMYLNGEGVTKDYVEAMKWFRKAVEKGYARAQFSLACIYAKGQGVPKDYVESYKWLLLAAAQDNEPAKKLVPVLERDMTREQMAEGQKLAREFKPRDKSQDKDVTRENVEESNPEATGSGFFITDDGYFITNQHVADRGATVRVVTASGIIPAKVIKVDELNDLTLLKAEGKFAELPVVLSRKVQLGATVATVGFPNIGLQGFSPKLAKGEIASLAGIQDDARHFQISVPVQPGNSGGALVDDRGNVIGVVVAKLSQKAALATSGSLAENVNYAIKSSYLLSFLESVPEVAAKLKEPNTTERNFEATIKDVEQAAVLVLVY